MSRNQAMVKIVKSDFLKSQNCDGSKFALTLLACRLILYRIPQNIFF